MLSSRDFWRISLFLPGLNNWSIYTKFLSIHLTTNISWHTKKIRSISLKTNALEFFEITTMLSSREFCEFWQFFLTWILTQFSPKVDEISGCHISLRLSSLRKIGEKLRALECLRTNKQTNKETNRHTDWVTYFRKR